MEFNLYLQTLKRGWWIVVLTMLVALNAALVFSYVTPPIYEATSRFVVSPNAQIYESSWDVVDSLNTLDRRSIINTYKELLASPSVFRNSQEIQNIGLDVVEEEYVISVVVIPDTNILKLTVTGPEPTAVLDITRAVGEQSLKYINDLYPVYNFSLLDTPSLDPEPIYPLPLQNAGLALLIGIIIGLSLAFAREQMATTLDKLRERSTIDNASSAYTREYFVRVLREQIAQDTKSTISLGFINFRGLDEVADVLPQAIYDRALRTITKTLIRELRGRDIVARWENSQLAVLLPATPGISVERTFQRIRAYLDAPIAVNESDDMVVRPDPCVGIVERNEFEDSDELIERAEMAMERASAFKTAAVVFLSTPFVLNEEEDIA